MYLLGLNQRVSGSKVQRFTVADVMVKETHIMRSVNGSSLGPPTATPDRKEKCHPARLRKYFFWIVPLWKDTPEISITVSGVFPVQNWDRSSQQFMWTLPTQLESTDPITAGAATVDVTAADGDGRPTVRKTLGKVVVLFGVVPAKTSYGTQYRPWHYLVKHDGDSDLSSYLNYLKAGLAVRGLHTWSSITLSANMKLNASIVTTFVNGRNSELIKLWITCTQELG